ncbi:N-acetyltransferase [Paenibacillus durus]|uniref:hypothetical protein n=1 Tax=Paenibacillus durus TaxID=44251 RepID=UPI000B022BF7|nr:hypothetical protein [Paenibacillus durus]
MLSVNEENSSALRLYLSAGFRDNGLRRMGPKGPQKILQYPLPGAAGVIHARTSREEEWR